MEQAKIWAKAVQDEKTDFDKEFIQQLVSMVRSLTQQLPCSLSLACLSHGSADARVVEPSTASLTF